MPALLASPSLQGSGSTNPSAALKFRDVNYRDGTSRSKDNGNGHRNDKGDDSAALLTPPNGPGDLDSSDEMGSHDELELDPDTLIARRSIDVGRDPSNPTTTASSDFTPVMLGLKRRTNSIPVRLEKTTHKGRYILTADDPDIKEILRKGIEREQVERGHAKLRSSFRDLLFTPRLTAFDRRNPSAAHSPFFGFFTLFWIAMVLMLVKVSMQNYRDYGSVLGSNQIMKMMFSHDVWVLAVTDGVMCAATTLTYLFQLVVHQGWLRWERGGWIVQNIWQSLFLGAAIGWAYFREWPWTHTIFVVLHGLVFLMKQHSYASYNGHLSTVYRRRQVLEGKLEHLEQMEPNATSPTRPTFFGRSLDGSRRSIDSALPTDLPESATNPRPSLRPRTATNFTSEKSDVATVARAIESGDAIDTTQLHTFENVIKAELADLTKELQGKSSSARTAYPHNLTLYNFLDYICLPTLVYELEYPRQERTNWWFVAEKITATFGVLCVMMVISQAFIYPPVAKTVRMKEAGMPLEQRWQELPFIVSDMLFPLLIEQLLTWYLIWECILNVLAELTCFADRGFYGDWWNSVTWDQYARDWNRPVHNFLLRHVYHSSISTFHLSRNAATFVTFLLSALVHEMCMAIMFKKVRGYLLCSQLLQMPLVSLSRSKLMKGRDVLGNVIFWIGLFIGPSLLTSLYLVM